MLRYFLNKISVRLKDKCIQLNKESTPIVVVFRGSVYPYGDVSAFRVPEKRIKVR